MSAASGLMFLSTPPVWVATFGKARSHSRPLCFYPRHPCGWRRENRLHKLPQVLFLSTPPVWVATEAGAALSAVRLVSIHATRVGGDGDLDEHIAHVGRVSIHATRVGGDYLCRSGPIRTRCFYPRHPCGWRQEHPLLDRISFVFLSTPPVWVATQGSTAANAFAAGFYPRHPCGWRPGGHPGGRPGGQVSIHATRVGGDG